MKKESLCHVFSRLPELHTQRLLLRRMYVTDAEDMYEYARRMDVTKYLRWSPHPDEFHTREYLRYIDARYAAGCFYDWAIVWKETGKMIGTCGFTSFDCPHDAAEIGYVIHPSYWGMGIVPEAVRAVLQFGFERLRLHRIEARFIEGNVASLRVMQKVGMTFEGYQRDRLLVKGVHRTIGCCSILAGEWVKQEQLSQSQK